MGLHPPHPLLQFTPFKFENLIKIQTPPSENPGSAPAQGLHAYTN